MSRTSLSLASSVLAHYSGVTVDGDPRELDLGVSVKEMAAVVTDDRLTLG